MITSLHQLAQDIQTRIREVAYIMWESAGRQQGMALDYWLAAEREVMTTFQTVTERLQSTLGDPVTSAEPTSLPTVAEVLDAPEIAPTSASPTAPETTARRKPNTRRVSSRTKAAP